MTVAAKARECILGDINLDAFLEHVDPDWQDKFTRVEDGNVYYASEDAWAFYTEFMTINEVSTLVAEAGA